ncbi:MAG TPA: c-type cytochrome [Longimicrobium sp.]|nr:c-type cytochrome [Longimicrobium sp.]
MTPVLAALREYQLSLGAPQPPAGSFDRAAAERGRNVFNGKGRCSSCHTGSNFTDADRGILHRPEETGVDPVLASRSTTGRYRTTPLRGAWQHPPYFHDGSAATLDDVVAHYDQYLGLRLTEAERRQLVEYLKSL